MTHINPLTKWREEQGYTQVELSDLLGLSTTTIRQVETGINTNLPDIISDFTDISNKDFHDWKKSCRNILKQTFKDQWPVPENAPPYNNAFGILMYHLGYSSVHAFAMDFCVRYRPVSHYLLHGGHSIPKELRVALNQAGYPYLKELEQTVRGFDG